MELCPSLASIQSENGFELEKFVRIYVVLGTMRVGLAPQNLHRATNLRLLSGVRTVRCEGSRVLAFRFLNRRPK